MGEACARVAAESGCAGGGRSKTNWRVCSLSQPTGAEPSVLSASARPRAADEEETMPETILCEHCGLPVPKDKAEQVVVESWPHYFCSEKCKIEWAELGEAEEEEL